MSWNPEPSTEDLKKYVPKDFLEKVVHPLLKSKRCHFVFVDLHTQDMTNVLDAQIQTLLSLPTLSLDDFTITIFGVSLSRCEELGGLLHALLMKTTNERLKLIDKNWKYISYAILLSDRERLLYGINKHPPMLTLRFFPANTSVHGLGEFDANLILYAIAKKETRPWVNENPSVNYSPPEAGTTTKKRSNVIFIDDTSESSELEPTLPDNTNKRKMAKKSPYASSLSSTPSSVRSSEALPALALIHQKPSSPNRAILPSINAFSAYQQYQQQQQQQQQQPPPPPLILPQLPLPSPIPQPSNNNNPSTTPTPAPMIVYHVYMHSPAGGGTISQFPLPYNLQQQLPPQFQHYTGSPAIIYSQAPFYRP